MWGGLVNARCPACSRHAPLMHELAGSNNAKQRLRAHSLAPISAFGLRASTPLQISGSGHQCWQAQYPGLAVEQQCGVAWSVVNHGCSSYIRSPRSNSLSSGLGIVRVCVFSNGNAGCRHRRPEFDRAGGACAWYAFRLIHTWCAAASPLRSGVWSLLVDGALSSHTGVIARPSPRARVPSPTAAAGSLVNSSTT